MYTGGTPEAIKFIEKYKKTGHVVDFYSEEHINSLDQSSTSYSSEDLKEFDASYGSDYRSHMLTIYIGNEDEEMLNELSIIYPPFKQLFSLSGHSDAGLHKPDFLLVNLPMTLSDNGSVVLQIKYGSKVIDIQKGKNSIEVKDGNHLIDVLESVKNATLAGELDTQIESAANIVKSRFKK